MITQSIILRYADKNHLEKLLSSLFTTYFIEEDDGRYILTLPRMLSEKEIEQVLM
ncbi:hypothetical protein BDV28DRAFT_130717, partial [Aspergillus coremiiformis]